MLRENGTVVVGLPLHTDHVLNPLDLCVFRPLKLFPEITQPADNYYSEGDKERHIYNWRAPMQRISYVCQRPECHLWFSKNSIWNVEIRSSDPNSIKLQEFTSSTVRPECLNGDQVTRAVLLVIEYSNDS